MIEVKFFSTSNTKPVRGTSGSAGYDITSSVDMVIPPQSRTKIPTGLYCQLPEQHEIQIRNRSGMSYKKGLLVIPGTVDTDYCGEISVIVFNLTQEDLHITKGMRIAQMIISKYEVLDFKAVSSIEEFDKTDRGSGGFGSTGYN